MNQKPETALLLVGFSVPLSPRTIELNGFRSTIEPSVSAPYLLDLQCNSILTPALKALPSRHLVSMYAIGKVAFKINSSHVIAFSARTAENKLLRPVEQAHNHYYISFIYTHYEL